MQIRIDRSWRGDPALPGERVTLELARSREALCIDVDAPFHGDPPPAGPRLPLGATPRLFEHEVVELFLLAPPDHYVEIELGPYGHALTLELRGVRQVVRSGLPLRFEARRSARRWQGRAQIGLQQLPRALRRLNACAIHGRGAARRFLSWQPLPGPRPDFHRLRGFAAFDPEALARRDG